MTPNTRTRESYDRVLAAIEQLGLKSTGRRREERMAQCPAHQDGNPSLHVTYDPAGRRTLLRCFADCAAEDIVAALGLTLADLYDEPLPPKTRTSRTPTTRPRRKVATAAAPRKPKPTPEEMYGAKTGDERVTAEYIYCSTDGDVRGRQVRYETPYERGYVKRFVQEHPGPDGSWVLGGWSNQGLYLLPDVANAKAQGRVIVVTEGEKDVETVRDRLEITATTNCGGSANWNALCTDELVGAREVWVLLDRDPAGYLRGLTVPRRLTAAGIPIVRIFLPVDQAGIKDITDHVDAGLCLDDLVAASPVDVLQLLIAAEPQKAARWVSDRILDTDVDLAEFLGERLPEVLQRVVDAAPDHSVVIEDYLSRRPAAEADGSGHVRRLRVRIDPDGAQYDRPQYKVYDDSLWRLAKPATEKTPERWSIVLGCIAEVARVEYPDNGDEQLNDPNETPWSSRYLVRWRQRADDGSLTELGTQSVPADKYFKGEWLSQSPAVAAGVEIPATAMDRGRAAEAIRLTSGHLTRRTPVYTATGWRKGDLGWFYVHAGAGSGEGTAITAAGEIDIRTQLTGPAAHISLPSPPDVEGWRDGIAEIEYLMDALPDRIGSVLIGIAARAAVGWTGPSLLLTGDYQAGKTSLATLLASFYDPTLPYDRTRISLAESGATSNAIRRMTNQIADCIVLLDDANPDGGTAAAAKRIAHHARAQNEQNERQRSTRDGTGTTNGGAPRGTQAMTAELSPADAGLNSAESRIMSIHLALGDVDTRTVLPDLHKKARRQRRCTALAGLIRWMAPRLQELRDDLESLTGREEADSYTRIFDAAGLPARMSRALADYLFGWRIWLHAAQDAGAVDSDRAEKLWDRAFAGLLQAGHDALEFAGSTHYDGQMRDFVASALSSAEGHMTAWGKNELNFTESIACGWKPDPRGSQFVGRSGTGEQLTETLYVPGGRHIGWVDPQERRAYLNPEAVLRLCAQMAHNAGSQWDTTRRVVGAALRAGGRSRPEVETVSGRIVQRAERRLRQGDRKVAVWDVSLDWLLGLDEEPGPDPQQLIPPAPVPDPVPGADHGNDDVIDQLELGVVALDLAAGAENLTATPAVPERPAAAGGTISIYRNRHPGEVPSVPVTFDGRNPPQLDPCVACGLPCSPHYGEIVIHPDCDAPADLVFDAVGLIVRGATDPDQPETDFQVIPAVGDVVDGSVPLGGRKPQRPVVAVADVDGFWLADGTSIDLPDDLTHIGQLAQVGLDLGLGWGEFDKDWRPERGQIWITAALVKKLGLPAELPGPAEVRKWRALSGHVWLTGAGKCGWHYGQTDGQPLPKPKPWTAVWRENGGGVTVVVPSWTVDGLHQIDKGDTPTSVALAQRIERFAAVWGLPYRWGYGVTGVDRLRHLHRTPGSTRITRTIPLPAPFLDQTTGERELMWHRAPTDAEAACPQLVGYDGNAMYSAAANSLAVGLDVGPEHLTGPVTFDPTRPGTWKVTNASSYELPGGTLLPLMDRIAKVGQDDSVWLTTPMLALLTKDWAVDLKIEEAWLWSRDSSGRVFDSLYNKVIRPAFEQLPRDGDEETRRLRRAVKNCVNHGFGRLARQPGYALVAADGTNPDPWWRPDWDRTVIANASAKLLRTVNRVGQATGRWPLAIIVDAVYYAADAGDLISVAPTGFPLDPRQLGKFKAAGSIPMPAIADRLRDPAPLQGRNGLIDLTAGSEH